MSQALRWTSRRAWDRRGRSLATPPHLANWTRRQEHALHNITWQNKADACVFCTFCTFAPQLRTRACACTHTASTVCGSARVLICTQLTDTYVHVTCSEHTHPAMKQWVLLQYCTCLLASASQARLDKASAQAQRTSPSLYRREGGREGRE